MLEIVGTSERLEGLLTQLETEIDILQVEKRIRGRVKKQMEKSQRDYYLNEQVKAIQKELGEGEEGADIEELEKKIIAAHMPKEARKKADAELKKLKLMSPMSAEATVVRNYIDTLINLPWKKKSKINNSISNAETVLDNDHYGLEKVKERILNTSRCNSAWTRSRRRSCAWSGLRAWQDLARPVHRQGHEPQVRAQPWAACATKPRSAAIAARISARCPARSSRT